MLEKTDGRQQVGVVISLGRLADGGAVPELAALLAKEDEELREVIVVALGRIATVPAADALRDFANQAPETLKDVVVDARLQAAESLCRQGEYQAAIGLCEPLLTDDSERVRAAALAATDCRQADRVAGHDPCRPGCGGVLETGGRGGLRCGTQDTGRNPDDRGGGGELAGPRQDRSVVRSERSLATRPCAQAALLSLNQADTAVRTVALEALIASGTAEDVATLADLASTDDDLQVRHAAFETLRLMTADGTNAGDHRLAQ